jgi:hypothetical protein
MDIPKEAQGRSMMGAIREQRPHKTEVFSFYMSGSLMKEPAVMVRDKKWKLTVYPEQQSIEERLSPDHPLKYTAFFDGAPVDGELYDMESDPDEVNNLFENGGYRDIRDRYVNKISEWKRTLEPAADYSKLYGGGEGKKTFLSFRLHEADNLAKTAEFLGGKGYLCQCARREPRLFLD